MDEFLDSSLKQFSDRVATDAELGRLNLLQIVRPSVRLVTQRIPQRLLRLGESRVGGLPDVPRDFEWPRWLPSKERDDKYGQSWRPERPAPLGFIAQIDLQAIPRIDDALPSSGWLYFFYDRYCEPWGFDPADRGCCRILYADGDRATLERATPPTDADSEHVAEACRIEAWAELTLPDDLQGVEYGTPVYQAYRALSEELTEAGGLTHHHLLGYPQLIQNPMELECQLAANGVYCGGPEGYQSAEAQALASGARDWRLLLQIDTDEDGPGWMWGDVGRIYYWIKREELASLRFEDAWLIFQCC